MNLRNAKNSWGEDSQQFIICKNTAEIYLQSTSTTVVSAVPDEDIVTKMESMILESIPMKSTAVS